MKAKYIPYSQIAIFSHLIQDYLAEKPLLQEFSTYSANLKGFAKKISQYTFKGDRKALVQVLQHQYENVPTTEATQHHIKQLQSENTYTITTGHQLNIFTGPLYFIFKIVSVLKLCKELKAEFPDKNFVPVYWMATEDHDFEEINHTFLEGKKITWPIETQGATGAVELSQIEDIVREYIAFLGVSTHADALTDVVKKAYLGHQNLADATRYLVNELFGTYGLVILDANDPALKEQFAPIMEADIISQKSFENITKTNQKLDDLGYKIQVQPREINFFYLDTHLRERLVFENGKYKVLNTTIEFSTEELKAEIQLHPEKFSPNVVMRPLYQEVILPNLAYIGGAGEIAYWLQLKSNFNDYEIDFPILIVRNAAMWMDKKAQHYQQKLALNDAELFLEVSTLQKQFIHQNSKQKLSLEPQTKDLQAIIHSIQQQAKLVDVNLEASSKSLQTKMEHLISSFEKKIFKAEKRHFSDALRQIEKLNNALFPNGGLQERKENFAVIYKDYGPEFIAFLFQNFRPLAKEFTLILAPNESI